MKYISTKKISDISVFTHDLSKSYTEIIDMLNKWKHLVIHVTD